MCTSSLTSVSRDRKLVFECFLLNFRWKGKRCAEQNILCGWSDLIYQVTAPHLHLNVAEVKRSMFLLLPWTSVQISAHFIVCYFHVSESKIHRNYNFIWFLFYWIRSIHIFFKGLQWNMWKQTRSFPSTLSYLFVFFFKWKSSNMSIYYDSEQNIHTVKVSDMVHTNRSWTAEVSLVTVLRSSFSGWQFLLR